MIQNVSRYSYNLILAIGEGDRLMQVHRLLLEMFARINYSGSAWSAAGLRIRIGTKQSLFFGAQQTGRCGIRRITDKVT